MVVSPHSALSLILSIDQLKSSLFYSIENNYVIIGPNKDKCRLFIKYKDKSKLENIIDADFDGIALTKKIDYDTLINNLDNISFYARIYE